MKKEEKKLVSVKPLIGVSLMISLAALTFSIQAYNRSGVDLERQLLLAGRQVEMGAESTIALAQAQAKLAAIRAEFLINQNYSETRQAIVQVRGELKKSFENAQGEIKLTWQSIDQGLEELESELRQESAGAIDSFQSNLEAIEKNIRP